MGPIAGIVLAALLGLGAAPHAGDRSPELSGRHQNTLRIAGLPGILDLRRFCECDQVTRTDVWFDSEGADVRYLLLTLTSDSNPISPNGRCGAGEETVLVWLKMRPFSRVRDSQTFLIASCWQTVETGAAPQTQDAPLEWRFTAVGNDGVSRDYVVTFDRRAPERGLHAHYTFEPW